MWKTIDRNLYIYFFWIPLNAMHRFMGTAPFFLISPVLLGSEVVQGLENLIRRRSPNRDHMWILVKTKTNNPCVP